MRTVIIGLICLIVGTAAGSFFPSDTIVSSDNCPISFHESHVATDDTMNTTILTLTTTQSACVRLYPADPPEPIRVVYRAQVVLWRDWWYVRHVFRPTEPPELLGLMAAEREQIRASCTNQQ